MSLIVSLSAAQISPKSINSDVTLPYLSMCKACNDLNLNVVNKVTDVRTHTPIPACTYWFPSVPGLTSISRARNIYCARLIRTRYVFSMSHTTHITFDIYIIQHTPRMKRTTSYLPHTAHTTFDIHIIQHTPCIKRTTSYLGPPLPLAPWPPAWRKMWTLAQCGDKSACRTSPSNHRSGRGGQRL